MSALLVLPDLLHRIDALDSGRTLCARPTCYAEAFRWLSPYCGPDCAPISVRDTSSLISQPMHVERAGGYRLLSNYRWQREDLATTISLLDVLRLARRRRQ